jgi:hypothetical protein
MAAMEKGIPLPEFPLEPTQQNLRPDPPVLPILGIFLFCLSIGAMIVLYIVLPSPSHKLLDFSTPLHVFGRRASQLPFLKSEFASMKYHRGGVPLAKWLVGDSSRMWLRTEK